MKKPTKAWGTEEPVEGGAVPMVYHFRPTSFVKVAPDKLRDWEDYFAKNVGLAPDSDAAMVKGRSATMSGSQDSWDDCDYV